MDSVDEDVSARVLLRRVLHTELPRSPVTRSASRVRRSVRLKHTPGLESPGVALRHRLKQKLHQSAQSPLPPPKRQRSLGGKTHPPAVATPPLYDDDITTRGLLRGIIQMDTDASLLMSGQPALQETEPNPESSVSSAGERTEGLSGAELSDLTLHTEPLTHVVRGLSRRKPQHAFNVSAFERQLDQLPGTSVEEGSVSQEKQNVSQKKQDVIQEKQDVSQDLDFSAGSKSGLNLTLKTPFVDKRTERAGLQRKVSNRRLPSVDAFDEAVQRCLEQAPQQDHSDVLDGKTLEDSSWQKFTLGLNDVTELYVHPAGSTLHLKKDDTAQPGTKTDRDAESNGRCDQKEEEENKVNKLSYVDEIYVLDPESVIQEKNDCDVELATQEEEEVVPSSQEEAEDDVSVSPEDDIMLAPTQAMTESPPESQDAERNDLETEEDLQEEDVQEDADTSQGLEQITRRAHRSEGGGAVLAMPAGQRVTKSLGAGLNPREKDLLEFDNRSRKSLQDVPDEEMEPQGSHLSPPPEVTTEQRSQQHDASIDEDLSDVEETEQRSQHDTSLSGRNVPDTEEDDLQEMENLSEDEDVMDSEPAIQSPEPHSPAQSEPEEADEEDDDDAHSEELSMKTPAFVKQKRVIASTSAQATPTVPKELNSGPARQVTKRRPRQKRETSSDILPKSYVMSVFKQFAKTKVASDVYPAINEILKKYFDRLADDLEVYATHAKRKTIEMEDFELLMRRQGFVTDSMPVNILIEKYLPMEYRKLLIPVATSGNKVVPNRRR